MASEYDRKFEEMKKYIPFLENMIKRLESNSTSSANPRQAQLDKIRSLRDLLLDKKKRMKMDNLLKCEQVLVNLYAKVEKRDVGLPLGDNMEPRTNKDSSDLQAVRNKLKNVTKIQNVTETLPEIARASEREEICEPGSKEPALFQRRPNKLTDSPTQSSPKKMHETNISSKPHSKRSYTRVLVSPEPKSLRCWSGDRSDDTSKDKPLFSRRSPIRTPRKGSPSYYKKERKKASREKKTSKDLNITLKVPEESLNSLNTEDILSRIITCSDGDVDIDTLRELRSQILGELKQTGTNDDISELILKSYNKKPKSRKKKNQEVEEGEISDSESEAIENIYGSLVVMDKDKKYGQAKTSVDKSNQQRKIQICLVINSEKEADNKPDNDLSESGVFANKTEEAISLDTSQSPNIKKDKEAKQNQITNHTDVSTAKDQNQDTKDETTSIIDKESNNTANPVEPTLDQGKSRISDQYKTDISSDTQNPESLGDISQPPIDKTQNIDAANDTHKADPNLEPDKTTSNVKSPAKLNNLSNDKSSPPAKNIANFYKPLLGDENVENQQFENSETAECSADNVIESTSNISTKKQTSSEDNNNTEESTQIPLLNEPSLPPKATEDVLSEIDILQALKNEILSETIPIAAADAQTPALHQPKITKVATAVEANSSNSHQAKAANSSQIQKKRISIENYKNKSKTDAKSLFVKKRSREEINKKQSLKLTEKECERFNFPARLSLDDDTDDISDTDLLDDENHISLNDIYGDLAPKSPDQDYFSDAGIDEPPVIIPAHPVKTNVSCSSDIDMRNEAPKLVTLPPQPVPSPLPLPPQAIPLQPIQSSNYSKLMSSTQNNDPLKNDNHECNKLGSNQNSDGKRTSITDPRLRRELNQSTSIASPNPYGAAAFEGTPKPTQFANLPSLMTLNMTPVYTPSYTPSMTPIRTPNARSYEMTPTRQSFEIDQPNSKHVYAPSFLGCDTNERDLPVTNERNFLSNPNEDRRSRDVRNLQRETSSSGSRESQTNYNPRNDQFYTDRRDGYNISDCPPTPGPSFGWSDCPGTPRNSFRDAPMTPNHSFGRTDCPSTPIHPFGRSDCPSTPSHPFGRSDGSSTPNHPFGRNDCPGTPIHPFGRTEIKDPRLNRRQFEFDSRSQSDEKDFGYQNDRNNRDTYKSHRNYGRSDSSRNYDRGHHRRNERYPDERGSRYASQRCFDREQSIGRNDKYYSNEPSGRGFDRVRRETSLSRASRDDNHGLFTRNRDRYDNRNTSNRDGIDNLDNQRHKSISRNMPGESSRSQSLSRNVVKEVQYGNTLPGKPQVARSFTIDTSVNATFQDLIESGKGIQVFDYTFDARRQRASSVGRSLTRESSIGRTLSRETKATDSPCFQRRNNFIRASSVGRALVEHTKEKTFQEIKADFNAYKSNLTKPESASKVSLEIYNKEDNQESSSRSKNDNFENESKQNVKQSYSPRKNSRDPRMRRDQRDKERNKSNSNSRDRRHSGIVYSSDNIKKGTIMGSGFGVKNYKIPKIKRPDPEPEETKTEITENSMQKVTSTTKSEMDNKKKTDVRDEKTNEDISEKNKTIVPKTQSAKENSLEELKETKNTDINLDESSRTKNKLAKKDLSVINKDDDLDKRVTRSSKKSDSQKFEETSKKKKRIRKNIIEDSGSEVETEKAETDFKTYEKNNTKAKDVTKESEVSSKSENIEFEDSISRKALKNTLGVENSDSSFAIDDIDIFSNHASDPVVDNINDLIADLDNDLGAKSGNDSFDVEIEKMMIGDGINSQEENILGDISELIEKDLNECNKQIKENVSKDDASAQSSMINDVPVAFNEQKGSISVELTSRDSIPAADPSQASESQNTENSCKENSINSSVEMKASNDETVSTTHVEVCNSKSNKEENECVSEKLDQAVEINELPTPDSTVSKKVQSDKTEESLPDSTIDIHCDISTDVTSTRDIEKPTKESESSSRKEVSAMESFGSLLSILQDKSKIKELLSMLGDQSGESEKIKKKLEKLSEIVSDDEDTNEDTIKENQDKQSNKSSPAHHSNVSSESRVMQNIEEIDAEIQTKSDDIVIKSQETSPSDILENSQDSNNPENYTEIGSSKDTPVEETDLKNVKPTDGAQSNNKSKEHLILSDETNELNVHPTNNDPCNDDLNEELESNQDEESIEITEKIGPKKTRRGKGRGKKSKFSKSKPVYKTNELRVQKPKIQKRKSMSRELQTLHEDIKEMFMSDDILNATGIRMCRLAKMVDKKRAKDSAPLDNEPVVVIKKYKGTDNSEEPEKKVRKKPGPKPKAKIVSEPSKKEKDKNIDIDTSEKPKDTYKPGPKSKTKQKRDILDPYEFESDSVADTNTTKDSDAHSSDSDNDSSTSETSIGSGEVLADIKKKPKKKRGSWQSGVIKSRNKKKKDLDHSNNSPNTTTTPLLLPRKPVTIPDINCFTDKTYCFQRGINTYDCRLCHYSGTEIVNHYKKQHTHTEVPLSRMDQKTAKKAIQQCEQINFHVISKIPSEKYTCRFCYKEFSKTRVALETFFWHVVSTHTGEYKHLCYECVNVTRCPFNLDIPPPPKDIKGQLIGYICGKCNFTQISLENLKTHVIVRHNDEQTEVYTINLGVMTNKAMKAMLRKSVAEDKPRLLRSSRSNQSTAAASDDRSEITGSDRISEIGSVIDSITPKIEKTDPQTDVAYAKTKNRTKPGAMKSKLCFETDDQERSDEMSVKLEQDNGSDSRTEPTLISNTFNEPLDNSCNKNSDFDNLHNETVPISQPYNQTPPVDVTLSVPDQSNEREQDSTSASTLQSTNETSGPTASTDIFEQPHFKLHYKENGSKEYVCCINGEVHYRTTLLISLKKHVQTKHLDTWDGYCCVCKVIVTLQGVKSSFRDCLTHFLDKHIDDFPLLENIVEDANEDSRSALRSSIDVSTIERTESPRSYIAVRPLADLIAKDVTDDPPMFDDNELQFPKIENVVSLGEKTVEVPSASPVYPTTSIESAERPVKPFQYEEVQAEVMSKKYHIVLDSMMPKDMLVRVFKCAGRFCSFTSDSAEDALVHASAHKQMGGEGALECAYCNFDAADNAIDLVMHVFKVHGQCQYSCILCFYRAAADQLVGAHFLKAHGGSGKAATVLRTTTPVASTASDSANMLSRETAVPYYVCGHGEGACKYRTYTSGKFCEHMQQKHGSEVSHPCNMCEEKFPTPAELVKHLKSHGVKLYQCTWCVHGADTESEMLSHAATAHPTKNPQAYLRVITNKDGSTDLRVLPLVYLNKLKVPIEDVTPSKVKENPTKEAERSIELEKLIRITTRVTEDTIENATFNSSSVNLEFNALTDEVITQTSDIPNAEITQATESIASLQEKESKETSNVSASAVVKKEPAELNQRVDVVYCLDSDEEQAQTQNTLAQDNTSQPDVIDLSDDEQIKTTQKNSTLRRLITAPSNMPTTFFKLSPNELYRCPECKINFLKMSGLKKHAQTCCRQMLTFQCPHIACPIVLVNISQLINHYNKDHSIPKSLQGKEQLGNGAKIYFCGLCKFNSLSLRPLKKHMKEIHNVQRVTISTKVEENGMLSFTLHSNAELARDMPKRNSVELPKKYGIEDVDKLPINPIMDSLVYCKICEFSTKVRLNMVRHLQLHAERQPVPQTAPVNPVPHLETNEMHFDKMVNLASSSVALRAEKLGNSVTIAPEAASRYPKYVPDRQRHTCGAKGCAYISVDEEMLRCHWETLHAGTTDYHCVHCPPHQQLNTTRTLTAPRILAHLKMHDVSLYACSSCSYYHFKRQVVEKHIIDVHKGGQVQIVREEGNTVSNQPTAAPTMDLKPWQCGLCVFKSMLRPEVVEHCSKFHQTKMQYKCAYCPFRTSTLDNITKHQANSHSTRPVDVFYYYYREGTVPDEADGTPRWQKQRQALALTQPVKSEPEPEATPAQPTPATTIPVDLNLVKKEVTCPSDVELSMEDLCKQFGEFCDPNGIKFKCPLCKTVTEHTRDAMRSHLYEELKYRRWSCGLCPYKAYHRDGLNEHMSSEHRSNSTEPSQLPINLNIEKWVSKLLDHQSAIINKNKDNFAKQKIMEAPVASSSRVVVETPKEVVLSSDSDLEQAFGPLGTSKNNSFCCPKCNLSIKDEEEMRNHMESELTKIRWCCTKCSDKFQTYHEAQFHCKSHTGLAARPKEAIRDPSVRSSWVTAVIQTQKQSMKSNETQNQSDNIDLTESSENSLLVVRYEKAGPSDLLKEIPRKRPAELDSDDDSLVICEPQSKKMNNRNCPFCSYRCVHKYVLKEHVLRHFNLKLMTCAHCDFNGTRKAMHIHLDTEHPHLPHLSKHTEIPNCLPSEYLKMSKQQVIEDKPKVVCLHCEKSVIKEAIHLHTHDNKPAEFGEKGHVVVKCCICLALRLDLESMQAHYKEVHPDIENTNYAYYKLQIDTREVHICGICNRRFTFIRDLRIHHSSMHSGFNLTYKTVPYRHDEDSYETRGKRKMALPNPPAKRIAKKSTSKLQKVCSFAKKSTTKLPTTVVESDSEEEYSYYGTKPLSFEQCANVKTMMPMYNTMVEIDVKKLSGILKIDPRVVVKDCKKNQ